VRRLQVPAATRSVINRLPVHLERLHAASELLTSTDLPDEQRTVLDELVIESQRAIRDFKALVAEHNLGMPWETTARRS
jgi:hypothetical protein